MNYRVLLGVLMVTAGVMVTPVTIYSADLAQQKFECEACKAKGLSKIFKNKKDLSSHKNRMHSASASCPKCNKTFKSAVNLKYHMRNKHREHSTYFCEIEGCNKVIKKNQANNHNRYHHTPKRCKICGESCIGEKNLVEHQKDHSDEKKEHTQLPQEAPVFDPVFNQLGGQSYPAQQGGQLPVQQNSEQQEVEKIVNQLKQLAAQDDQEVLQLDLLFNQQRDPLSAQQNLWGQEVPEFAPVFYQPKDQLPVQQNPEQREVEKIVNQLKQLVSQND